MREEAETDGQDGWAGGSWGSEKLMQVEGPFPSTPPIQNRGIN